MRTPAKESAEGYRRSSPRLRPGAQASMRNRFNTLVRTAIADFVDLVIFFSLAAFLTMMVLAMK